MNKKVETTIIKIPLNTPSGTTSTDNVEVPKNAKTITGVSVIPLTDGNVNYYLLAFKDTEQIYIKRTEKHDYTFDNSMPAEERFIKTNIKNLGHDFSFEITLPSTITSEILFLAKVEYEV